MDGVGISVRELVAEISAAFETSPLELALILGMMALMLGILIGYWVHSRRVERRQREAIERERYERAVQEHSLSESEEALIGLLAEHLDAPLKKHLLLSNKAIFNSCAKKLVVERPELSDDVSALRLRLGFRDARPDEPVSSTTEIPVGASVLLVRDGQRATGARVTTQQADAVVVAPIAPAEEFHTGMVVRLLYHNRAGVFAFRSRVVTATEGRLHIDHCETPEQIQRRRYYRHPIRRPAYVRPVGSGSPPEQTDFVEIGGGGASIGNPYGKYAPGDDLEISFSPDSDRELSVVGTVVRTSRGGDVLHVRFEHVRESTRDRIYRLIFGADRGNSRNPNDNVTI